MKKHEIDMCHGPIGKQILLFSLPLMLSNVLQVLFNMADVAVVGRFAGADALGSVGSTTTLLMLFAGILIGTSGGVNVLVALYRGAKSKKDLTEMVHTAAIVSAIIGLILMSAGLLLAEPILVAMKTKEELLDGAVLYFRICMLGIPPMAMFNYGNAVLSAIGDTKRPLYYLGSAGVINVILNLIFVIGCDMGVAGVSLATIIAQYISAILILRTLIKTGEDYQLTLSKLKVTRSKIMPLLKIGIPSGMQNGIFMFANLFIQVGVNSFDAVYVSGNAAAANADALVYDVMAAFYTALASFIGQNLGARNRKRIMQSYLIGMFYAAGIGLIMGILLVVFGNSFLSLFTTEAAVRDAGMVRLTIMAFSYWVSAFMDGSIAASRGLGRSVVPTFIVIMGSCVFRIVWIYTIFAYFGTIGSLYLLYVFSWTITAAAEMAYFIYVYRKETAWHSHQAA